jgi:membrane-associated phospholipid phosphatase
MTRPRIAAAGTALSFWLTSAPVVAQTAASTHELRWEPALDVTVTAGGLAVWITSEALKGDIAPSRCRWCSVDPLDASLRDALVWHDTALADALSNVTGIALLPLSTLGLDALEAAHDGALRGAPEDALLIAEATILAADVDQLTKLIVGRERPFVHALPPEQKSRTRNPSDNNLSFFSGHSTEAFALATASGTVGTMRGYRWAPLAWSVGGTLAATTAYLRIAADKHWLTDVVVGAVVGAGIGFAVPYLFHPAVDDPPRSSASAAIHANSLPMATALTIAW